MFKKSYFLPLAFPVFGLALLLLTPLAAQGQAPVHPFSAVAQIKISYQGFSNLGSGTLIATNKEAQRGLVATCAHLWEKSGSPRRMTCQWGQHVVGAYVIKIDRERDLCLLGTGLPPDSVQPVAIGKPTENIIIGGHGNGNNFLFAMGKMGGTTNVSHNGRTVALTQFVVGAQAKSGDSGGPAFNSRGELVGVLWGARGGKTYISEYNNFISFCESEFMRKQCRPGQDCYNPGYNGSGWRSVPSRPSNPPNQIIIPWDRPLPGAPKQPQQPKKPRPAPQPTPCDCDSCKERLDALEKEFNNRLAALQESVKGLKPSQGSEGPAGPQGPPGAPGPPGEDGKSIDPQEIANIVLASLEQRLVNIENRLENTHAQEPGEGVVYYRIVADESTAYWARISDYYERASEAYSQIKVVPPPDFPVGQMPQMVAYQNGKPMGVFKGGYAVENALASISRGDTPLPTN